MNCSKCTLEIALSQDQLKCRGCCNHFHRLCLVKANKNYKPSLITVLLNIENLLWFCDECLPNTLIAISSHGTHEHNLTKSLEASPLTAPIDQNTHTQQQQQQADVSTGPIEVDHQDESSQLAISDNPTISVQNAETNASKKRRLSTDDDDDNAAPILPAAPRRASTNYRCIYLSPYPPTMMESAVTTYAVADKDRQATEIMECKRLLPAKCNMNKVTFVSFKLTVHAEFFDVYMDPSFWPDDVKAAEFVTRPPKNRKSFPKVRVNPFAFQTASRKQQNVNPPPSMTRNLPNDSNSRAPFNSHRPNRPHQNNNNNNNRRANSNPNPRSNANQRGSLPNRKNYQRQFSSQTSRRSQQQNSRPNNNKNSHQNRGQRSMDAEQMMSLFEQFAWHMKSFLSQR